MKIFSFTIYTLVFFACLFMVVNCTKEYSYEGGLKPESSVYTIVAAGNDCSGSLVSGSYYASVPLGASNTVSLEADVSKAGSYSLTTNTSDGFYFTGNGNFIDTGIHTIVLYGNGTPGASGVFSFVTPGTNGCGFDVTVMKQPPDTGSYALVGSPGNCSAPIIAGDFIAGTSINSATVTVSVDVKKTGDFVISTDTLDGIYFSASGRFTQTGIQKVTLKGNGTPSLAANLIFRPSSTYSGCTFSLTILPPGSLANYVLESNFGNPNPCTYVVSGQYNAGVALSSSNVVRINVYVIATGTYAISTGSGNGVSFYAAGTFTTTGTQYVYLTGSGTPLAKGVNMYAPTIVGPAPSGGASCAFQIAFQ